MILRRHGDCHMATKTKDKGMSTTLYVALVAATGIEAGKLSLTDWTQKTAEKIMAMDDGAFAKLPKAVQSWFDVAAEALNSDGKKPVPQVPGFDGGAVPVVEGKTTKAAAKVARPAKKSSDGKDSISHRMRKAVIANPQITFEAACKQVGVNAEVRGFPYLIYNDVRQVMALLAARA